jgi:hypothetical protein
VTLDELKTLMDGDRVTLTVGKREHAPGKVWASDDKCVEIHWPDGTSSLIWFSHCADGRDTRHLCIERDTKGRKRT